MPGGRAFSDARFGATRPWLGSCMLLVLVDVVSTLLLWESDFVRWLKGAFSMFPSIADCGCSLSLFAVVGRDTFVLCGAAGAVGVRWKPGRYPRFEIDPDCVAVCSRNGPSSEGIGVEAWVFEFLLGLRRKLLDAFENRPPVLCPSFRRRETGSVVVLMLTLCFLWPPCWLQEGWRII
jgi:hypothetical protein